MNVLDIARMIHESGDGPVKRISCAPGDIPEYDNLTIGFETPIVDMSEVQNFAYVILPSIYPIVLTNSGIKIDGQTTVHFYTYRIR